MNDNKHTYEDNNINDNKNEDNIEELGKGYMN